MKKSLPIGIALSLCAIGSGAPAMAEEDTASKGVTISADAAVSSFYLWRGLDLCGGGAEMSGTLAASHDSGAYALVWGSSCDGFSSEYDLVVGYATEIAGVGIDVSLWNYMYPQSDDWDELGDETEIIINLSYKGVGFTIYDNVASSGWPASYENDAGATIPADNNSYFYYTVDYSYEKFSGKLGWADPDDHKGRDTDYIHLDLTYSYNDNLSFTVSKIIDVEDEALDDGTVDDDTLFLVSYSIPIDMK